MQKCFQKGGVRLQVTCGGRWASWVAKGGVPGAPRGLQGLKGQLWVGHPRGGELVLTSQDEVQELEGRLEAGAADAALVGIQGEEGQAAEESQEASSYGEAAGHLVAIEDAVEL